MNSHALGVLEYQRVLELAATRASSNAGAARIRGLVPHVDIAVLDSVHAHVTAMRALVESEAGWTPQAIPDLETSLSRLRLVGGALSGDEFVGVLTLLRSSRLTKDRLSSDDQPAAALSVLAPFRERLLSELREEAEIGRVVADDGTVKDAASSALRRVRRELRGAEGELIALLERIMQRLDSHHRVPDMSVTVRNGRYVIPIRREGRGLLGGIVHDTSSTGATLFVEPPAAIDACNRIRELETEEAREIDRILLALSDRLRPWQARLADAADALAEIDSLYGRARFAIDFRCSTVSFTSPDAGFKMKTARHPLLVDQGIDVVPFDLEMSAGERTLLVSGPNTGGKTVLLKTLGLLSVLAQAGLPVPVGAGSMIVVYDDIFADVGDEQSIAASLSTFSAHVKNIAEILRSSTDRSLVLLDELGSGTDPLEGAALGGAVLEALTRRGAMTVATTHLGALKELATEVTGIVNASLQFDAELLAPTYVLIKGIPGRSYGISIARRLQLPENVLRRAEERVPQVERDVNALLQNLEQREAELSRREEQLRDSQESSQRRAHGLAERDTRLRARERNLERDSRQEARRYLLDAREQVERAIRDLKESSPDTAAEAARAARQRVEQLAEAHRKHLDRPDDSPVEPSPPIADDQEPRVGELVHVQALGGRAGRLLELRDDECLVVIGDVKLTFPRSAVVRSSVQDKLPSLPVAIRGDLPDLAAATEIDVRGTRASDIDEVVMQALDAAIRADLPSLRIIHGKGTGALRERVAEILQKDTRVRSFRLGAWNEGGAGVTVAEL